MWSYGRALFDIARRCRRSGNRRSARYCQRAPQRIPPLSLRVCDSGGTILRIDYGGVAPSYRCPPSIPLGTCEHYEDTATKFDLGRLRSTTSMTKVWLHNNTHTQNALIPSVNTAAYPW